MFRKTIAVACAAAGLVGAMTAPATARNPEPFTDTLGSGQCVTWNSRTAFAQLDSPSRRFSLWLAGNGLVLDEHVTTRAGGTTDGIWRMDLNRRGRTASLCMQRDGNLVWRVDGRVGWTSRTSGRGNVARVLDTGNVVVRSPGGKTRWSSGTTSVLLTRGDILVSGRTLVRRQYHSGSAARPKVTSRLTMTAGGDLVLRNRTKRTWHSNTHVRGSRLTVTADGRLAVLTPGGRTVWRSPAVGRNAVARLMDKGKLSLHDGRRCWVRPSRAGDCYTG